MDHFGKRGGDADGMDRLVCEIEKAGGKEGVKKCCGDEETALPFRNAESIGRHR